MSRSVDICIDSSTNSREVLLQVERLFRQEVLSKPHKYRSSQADSVTNIIKGIEDNEDHWRIHTIYSEVLKLTPAVQQIPSFDIEVGVLKGFDFTKVIDTCVQRMEDAIANPNGLVGYVQGLRRQNKNKFRKFMQEGKENTIMQGYLSLLQQTLIYIEKIGDIKVDWKGAPTPTIGDYKVDTKAANDSLMKYMAMHVDQTRKDRNYTLMRRVEAYRKGILE